MKDDKNTYYEDDSALIKEQRERQAKRREVAEELHSAFVVKPNAGQTWEIKVGFDEQGSPVMKSVKILAVANTGTNPIGPPTVMFRTSQKELLSQPMADWIDGDTFYVHG